MKLETHIPQEFIEAIAQEVFAKLKPLVAAKTRGEDDLPFNPEQLAAYLGVNKQWVYERVSLGEIPHTKMGRYLRFRKSAIEKWLDSKSVTATSPYPQIGKLMRGQGGPTD
jgi:excisionase family DNA binding protein